MPAVPAYLRIADDIRTKIASGEWPPRFKLPPPGVLAAAYAAAWNEDVSAATVRRATDRLQAVGLLTGRQGVAVQVAEPPPIAEPPPE